MLEIVFTVCSIVQGARCNELPPLELDPAANAITCMMAVQVEGAKYVDTHPNFYVVRGTCGPARVFTKS